MKTGEKALAGVGLAIPVGYVIWEATRRKNGVGIEAAGELPLERTWNAITVATEEPPTGKITEAVVVDRTTGRRYFSRDFPVAIPPEHAITAMASGVNTSGKTLLLRMTVEFRDPAGVIRASKSNTESVDHGRTIRSFWSVPIVPLDREGTWLVTGRLEEA